MAPRDFAKYFFKENDSGHRPVKLTLVKTLVIWKEGRAGEGGMTEFLTRFGALFPERATKYCGDDGQWLRHPEGGQPGTNFTLCSVRLKEKMKVTFI